MIFDDQQKSAHLLALFKKSNLPPVVAAARVTYEAHVSAVAAVRLARCCTTADRVAAERFAAMHRARWRRCREKIIVMRWERPLPHQ